MDVPYATLDLVRERAEEMFPNATRIVPLWTPASKHEAVIEVWTGDSARVYAVEAIA